MTRQLLRDGTRGTRRWRERPLSPLPRAAPPAPPDAFGKRRFPGTRREGTAFGSGLQLSLIHI
ncbi:MAG TPA: hypothetical protein DCQ35_06490, partial [Rhodospirillum rubrum]|nr:hypothetical protein [Rhodospirillum rubrum]